MKSKKSEKVDEITNFLRKSGSKVPKKKDPEAPLMPGELVLDDEEDDEDLALLKPKPPRKLMTPQ